MALLTPEQTKALNNLGGGWPPSPKFGDLLNSVIGPTVTGYKGIVRTATTANIVLSGLQVIDGVALNEGDRVLVKDQAVTAENGIRTASVGPWVRAADFDEDSDIEAGLLIVVGPEPATQAMNGFVLATSNPIVLDVTGLTFGLVFPSVGGPPTGAAGGGLAGSYPGPTVNGLTAGVLTNDTAHGVRGGGSQHALAVAAGAAGFLSGADKTKLNNIAADVQVFSTSGIWTKPVNAKIVSVVAIGGGSGGGSGRCGAAGSARFGGGGGGGGGITRLQFDAATLGATESVIVGAGGIGGAAVGPAATDGIAGGAGGSTTFGAQVTAGGGIASSGGSAASGGGGIGSIQTSELINLIPFFGLVLVAGANGGGSSITGTSAAGYGGPLLGGSGGGGGGVDAANVARKGGAGGAGGGAQAVAAAGGVGGVAGGAAGVAGSPSTIRTGGGGGGGGGGSASAAVSGGIGGAGAIYGAAGGGGGAGTSGGVGVSGAGGNGSAGFCIVFSWAA